jgi:tRNA A-37 threonylcarbamoyl transferase component Bud32
MRPADCRSPRQGSSMTDNNQEESSAIQSKSSLFVLQGQTVTYFAGPSPANADAFTLKTGDIVDDKYQIIRVLGEGGMGAVYKAKHMLLHKDVAFKTFKTANSDQEAILRFQREAQALAKLNNANVVQVFDYGVTKHNLPYYTMEYLQGESLSDKLRREGPLSVPEMVRIFSEVGNGLSAAHKKGILHRDIKPSNIFLEKTNTGVKARLVDFGLASPVDSARKQSLTTPGLICGSPLYMSPEQGRGEKLETTADIYSLGVSIYEALTGTPPIIGDNSLQTIMIRETRNAPTLAQNAPGVNFPPELEKIVATMLRRNPGDRQQQVQFVIDDLEYLLTLNKQSFEVASAEEDEEERQLKRRPLLPVLVGAALTISVIGAGIAYFLQSNLTGQKAPAVKALRIVPSATTPEDKPQIFSSSSNCRIEWPHHFIGSVLGDNNQSGDGTLTITYRTGAPVDFDQAFIKATDYLARMKDVPLTALQFTTPFSRAQLGALLPNLAQIKSLVSIDFTSHIEDKDLKYFEDLPSLKIVSFRKTLVTGAGLLGLYKNNHHITIMQYADGKNISILLKGLKGDKRLTSFTLGGYDLSEADLNNLTTLKLLTQPGLRNCNITDEKLKLLLPLNTAVTVDLESNPLTPASLPTFLEWKARVNKRYPSLPFACGITESNWSESDIERFKLLGPYFRIKRLHSVPVSDDTD